MRFLLIDYQPDGPQVNRDQTGTFGSHFEAGGRVGALLQRVKGDGVRLPVLSFATVTALLRRAGHTVEIISALPEQTADVALFATTMYHWRGDVAFLRQLKARHPAMRIGVLGGFSQSCPELFQEVADFNIHGEAEVAIQAFLDGRWDLSGPFHGGVVEDPDALPMPDWDGFPVERYRYHPILTAHRFLTTQTARGCSHGCPFCPYLVVQGARFRFRDPAKVVEELIFLQERYDVHALLFRDLVFSASKKRVLEICAGMERHLKDWQWACETRVDALAPEVVTAMARAGLKAVNLGIESPDGEMLVHFGKKSPQRERILETVGLLHHHGIKVQAFYMLGLWEDTEASMHATIEFARDLNTYSAQFCVATPFPGTTYHQEVEEHLLHRDYERYTEYQPVLRTPAADPETVLRFRDRAYHRYYLNPRWIARHGVGAVAQVLLDRLFPRRAR